MRIVVDENIPAAREAFASFGDIRLMPGRSITRADLQDVDALLVRSVTRVDAQLLDGTAVRFVGSATAGADHVDEAWLASRGIHFAAAPGSNATAVAEYVVAALLEWLVARDVSPDGLTIGVVGCGHVGSRVARLAGVLGLRVLCNDPPLAAVSGDSQFRDIAELQAKCDIITLHMPLTHSGPFATANMINADWLARSIRLRLLINTSRGEVVVENDLKAAIAASRPADVVLDVWRNEPNIDADLAARAFLATPHIAGYSEEGKLAGTQAVYDALCDWASAARTWHPARCDMIAITAGDSSGDLLQDQRAIVRQVCNLQADDNALRRVLFGGGTDKPFRWLVSGKECNAPIAEERPAANPLTRNQNFLSAPPTGFDALRRSYGPRHEFAAHRVNGIKDAALSQVLASFGFAPGYSPTHS